MRKKYSVKRALIASVLTIALCFSMLVGTTFAWFTDSVSSGTNTIIAGNLDIEVYYAYPSDVQNGVIADSAWKLMTAESPVLNNDARWEPGYTQLVYFKIKNVGSLAAKYKFGVEILGETEGTNVNGEKFKLSDKIQAYANACTNRNLFYSHCVYTERDIALNPPNAPTPFYDSLSKVADGTLANDEGVNSLKLNHMLTLRPADEWDSELYVTMALWMPTDVGNEANYLKGTTPPQIDLGITVVATQDTYEEDSYGKDYDEGATLPAIGTSKFEEPTTKEETIPAGNANVTIPVGSEGTYEFTISNIDESKDEDGNDVLAFDLDLTKDGVKVEDNGTDEYKVSYFLGRNRNLAKVIHDGEVVQDAVYDPNTGYVTFTVGGFSPFEIVSYTSLISTADELVENLHKGGNFVLANDIDLAGIKWVPVGNAEAPFKGVIDGNGYSILNLTVADCDYAALISHADAGTVVRNVCFENVNISSTKHAAAVACVASNGITVENVTVSGAISAPNYAGGILHNASNAVIKNCVNFATVSASRAAGVASWVTVNADVQNCVNYGAITGSTGASGIAHGFAGSVKNCTNYGKIVSNGVEPAAGIAGVQKAASTYEYCVNYGAIVTTEDNPNASAAGILGQTPGSKATLVYCANHGAITAEQSYAAGIAYSLYGTVDASYCYNDSAVSGADGAGAIAPKAQYGSGDKASYCLNAGVITSTGGKVYLGSNNNTSAYDISTGTLVLVGKTDAVALADALAVLNGGENKNFFKESGNTIVPESASTVLVSDKDELIAALKAQKNIVLANDITITENWDARYTGAKTAYAVVIDGAGHTLKFTNTIDDKNHFAVFRFEKDATVKNLTFDLSEAIGTSNRFRAISAKCSLIVDNCTFIGNADVTNSRGIIFGEGNNGQVADSVSITNSTFVNFKRGITDNENATDFKSVVVSGNKFTDAAVYISAYESITFTNNVLDGACINVTSHKNAAGAKAVVTDNVIDAKQDNVIGSASKTFTAANVTAQDGIIVNAK